MAGTAVWAFTAPHLSVSCGGVQDTGLLAEPPAGKEWSHDCHPSPVVLAIRGPGMQTEEGCYGGCVGKGVRRWEEREQQQQQAETCPHQLMATPSLRAGSADVLYYLGGGGGESPGRNRMRGSPGWAH